MADPRQLLEDVESLQSMLIGRATGSFPSEGEFTAVRRGLVEDPTVGARLPRFVRTCRSLNEFWGYISAQDRTYAGRKNHIWEAFRPVLEFLESGARAPSDDQVADAMSHLDSDVVLDLWRRALERRSSDPEGAITASRTLLESVCKHILDDLKVNYPPNPELPQLYGLTAEQLQLSPAQHSEDIFKRILGGCRSVVEGLASLRNRFGDAHGAGKAQVRPAARHAELAVNLAGTMAAFLVATWLERKS
jgi:hypothetical protein